MQFTGESEGSSLPRDVDDDDLTRTAHIRARACVSEHMQAQGRRELRGHSDAQGLQDGRPARYDDVCAGDGLVRQRPHARSLARTRTDPTQLTPLFV